MKTTNLLCALVAGLLGGTAFAVEPMVPYDNFNPMEPNPERATKIRGIDPARWADEQSGSRLQSVRELAFTRLRLMGKADTGSGRLGLRFTNPSAVTAMEAKVRLNNAKARGCASPGFAGAESAVELTGRFFNAGTPTAGSARDDITASIRIVSRSTQVLGPGELRVEATVERCVDATCTARTRLSTHDLGLVHEGEVASLRVQWDAANHQFLFQRDRQPEVLSPYRLVDTTPPGSPSKAMVVTHALPTCPSTDPRPLGYANAYLHDVFVNQSAAP
jgi:hypothetical protein